MNAKHDTKTTARLSRRTRAGYAALRRQFTTPALILSIVALVLAVAGGAYAAGGGLSSKQKKEVTAIAKKYAGKNGTNGTIGTNGAPGEKGAAGTNGSNGSNGSNGVSAEATSFTGASEPVGANCSHEGGLEVKSGGPVKYVCNGKKGANGTSPTTTSFTGEKTVGSVTCKEGGILIESEGGEEAVCNGSPWTAGGTLPKGATETGILSAAGVQSRIPGFYADGVAAQIGFSIPLASSLSIAHAHAIAECEGEGEQVGNRCENTPLNPAIAAHECSGNKEHPGAAEGNFCLFIRTYSNSSVDLQRERVEVGGYETPPILGNHEGEHTWPGNPETLGEGIGTTGAVLFLHALPEHETEEMNMVGTWAVGGN